MITKEQLHRDLESILEMDPNSIDGTESLSSLPWDSMAVVMFIAMADQNYSAVISPSKLADAKNVSDLYSIVANPS